MRNHTFSTYNDQMDDMWPVMLIAVRVLRAISEDRLPHPLDLRTLRRFAPALAGLPPVDLACGAIRKVVERRAEEARRLLADIA